nr:MULTISPECIES: PAAR domain-containing protein [unclassified Gilliamella]
MGDDTTTGGKVISASNGGFSQGQGIACLGDYASCPKCTKGYGSIIEGTYDCIVDGKPAAYDGCIVACGCPIGENRIIATKSFIYVNVAIHSSAKSSSFKMPSSSKTSLPIFQNLMYTQSDSPLEISDDTSKIRLDAKRLMDCTHELCEKHLYYNEIKQSFIDDVDTYAMNIVNKVESGEMSYEEGAKKIKTEENNLWKQSFIWSKNGLSIFGGVGMIQTGVALCSVGLSCLIGAPMIAHGGNGIYEGGAGIVNGVMNEIDGGNRSMEVDGPLRGWYKDATESLGFDSSIGDIAYDSLDLSMSVGAKLKLVPKLNKFGNPIFKLFKYGRRDLENAYKQMSKKLLTVEILGDAISLRELANQLKKAFILNKDTNQVSMVVKEPETIINTGQIVENCSLIITIGNDDAPDYYSCESSDGSTYRKDRDGNIIK